MSKGLLLLRSDYVELGGTNVNPCNTEVGFHDNNSDQMSAPYLTVRYAYLSYTKQHLTGQQTLILLSFSKTRGGLLVAS